MPKQAELHFDQGEPALQTVSDAYEMTRLAEDAVRTGILVAICEGLLFYAKKTMGYEFKSYPYTHFSSIDMGKNLAGEHIGGIASGAVNRTFRGLGGAT